MQETEDSGVDVSFNEPARRFEAHVAGSPDVAYIDVVPGTNIWSLVHTEVPASFRGQGIGSALVRGALKHVRDLGANVKPVCPFVVTYLREHPAEADVVLPRHRHLIE
ncbi:MAG TPA: GNAT family N-acetyltransferase [Trueperaceae bacterium]|nr:GNAT family N-acetyltransferase [Trueperaceae bacterium]